MDGEALVSYCLNGDEPNIDATFAALIPTPRVVSPPNGPVVMFLPNFFSPSELTAFSEHYELLKELGYFHGDEKQCCGRLLLFNDSMSAVLHARLEGALSTVLQKPMRRSYSLAAIYPTDCELERHVDRPECGWTISVLLGVRGNCNSEEMGFGFSDRDVVVLREQGDAVLFDGTTTPHWRTAKSTSAAGFTTLLLHFVSK